LKTATRTHGNLIYSTADCRASKPRPEYQGTMHWWSRSSGFYFIIVAFSLLNNPPTRTHGLLISPNLGSCVTKPRSVYQGCMWLLRFSGFQWSCSNTRLYNWPVGRGCHESSVHFASVVFIT